MSKSTRDRILRSAGELIESATGPVSMGDIAAAAGVTRQLLYFHFDGRTDLLLELSRLIDSEVRTPERQARVDDAPDGLTALREAVALQGAIKPRIAGIVGAVDRLRAEDDAAAAAWNERERARFRRAGDVIGRLSREGRLHPSWDVTTATGMLWSLTSQRAWSELVEEGGWSTDQWVTHTTALIERAFVVADDSA